MVFDVKFDLRRKARLVAGGNHTDPSKEDIYSGVIGVDTVRLGFMIAQMNGLRVCAGDISLAFLYGKTREKIFIMAGPEFGPELQGKPLILDKSIYGLRTSAARFHEHLSEKLMTMGFRPSKADSDFWIRDAGDHYEYIGTYVDDIMVFSRKPMEIIEIIKETYSLKGVGAPDYYLGGDVQPLDDTWKEDNVSTALSAQTYIENVVKKYEALTGKPFKEYKAPMDSKYHPETDDTPLLDPMRASIYRGYIGSGNWMITLGRFDIHFAINTLSRYSGAPREGHMEAVRRVFGYLKKFNKGRIIIDDSYPEVKAPPMEENRWSEMYPDAEIENPKDMPEPRGKKARIMAYVDADHAHDLVTRRSVTGILLYVNNTPLKWTSKRQNTIETSTYGSELVAARLAVEQILEYRYKLQMLGVPVDEPHILLGDNMSVVISCTQPSSHLKKKHNAISYHRVREIIATGKLEFRHVRSEANIADILTKPLPPDKFLELVLPVLFRKPRNRCQETEDNQDAG